MSNPRRGLIVVAALSVVPGAVPAQTGSANGIDEVARHRDRVQAQTRMGFAYPTAELSEFLEAGPTMWVGGSYQLTRQIAAGGEIGASYLGDDVEVYHALAGIDVALTPPDASPFNATVRLSTGRTFYSDPENRRARRLEADWTVGLGGRVGYRILTTVSVSLTAEAVRTFQEADDIDEEGPGSSHVIEGFDSPTILPVTMGVSVGLR